MDETIFITGKYVYISSVRRGELAVHWVGINIIFSAILRLIHSYILLEEIRNTFFYLFMSLQNVFLFIILIFYVYIKWMAGWMEKEGCYELAGVKCQRVATSSLQQPCEVRRLEQVKWANVRIIRWLTQCTFNALSPCSILLMWVNSNSNFFLNYSLLPLFLLCCNINVSWCYMLITKWESLVHLHECTSLTEISKVIKKYNSLQFFKL